VEKCLVVVLFTYSKHGENIQKYIGKRMSCPLARPLHLQDVSENEKTWRFGVSPEGVAQREVAV
jgi:hypothetical protein